MHAAGMLENTGCVHGTDMGLLDGPNGGGLDGCIMAVTADVRARNDHCNDEGKRANKAS